MQGRGKKPITDLTGRRFSRLVVLGPAPRGIGRPRWFVRCDCGRELTANGNALGTGNTKSCGCLKGANSALRTHGLSNTRAHGIWKAAKQRCFCETAHNYRHYGGRGITMCPEWAADFAAFFRDMGECPPGMSLERDDYNGNYEPGNCRWATQAEQVRNTSRNIMVEVDGKRLCLKDFAEVAGVSYVPLRLLMKAKQIGAHEAAATLRERRLRRQSTAVAA